jgi:flagellar assembly protein FliH
MGKIVKSARFADGKYVVEVPRTDLATDAFLERDDPFGAIVSFAEPSGNGHVDVAEVPNAEQQIDWETLRAEAEAIVDRAAGDAEKLIRQAESTALEEVARAKERAAKIEEDARSAGHEQGYRAGKASAEEELAPVITTMRELIESIRVQRAAVISAAEPELVRLAMAIAERIVHGELATNPNVVVENVRQALTRLVSREVVTLRVNPADVDAIRKHRDGIVSASDVEHLRIVEDQRVDRGGVVIETDSGTIDSKVSTQLREARRAIVADEEIALGDEEVLRPPAQAS